MVETFHGQVSEAVAKSKRKMHAVWGESIQDLAEEVTTPIANGGNMPKVTGFLQNSFVTTTGAPPAIDPDAVPPPDTAPNTYTFNIGSVTEVLATADMTDTIHLRFTAAYARVQEHRFGFVRLPAQDWPRIVKVRAKQVENL